MKTVRIALAVLLAGGLLLASAGVPDRGGPVGLIKIPKGPGYSATRVARLQVDVRQELATCLLALADRADMALLRRSGVRFTVVDRSVGRREILLVGTAAPGALASLRSVGHAIAVEPGAAVFWTENGDPAEAVPAGLPRKALAANSITPSLSTVPGGSTPAPAASLQDPFVETLVGLVSTSSLDATVQTLQDFQTRYASTTNCEAAGEALFSPFSALGLDEVRFEPFTFAGSYSSRNVVAEKTGRDLSRRHLHRLRALRLDLADRDAHCPWPRGPTTTPAASRPSSRRPASWRPTTSTSRSGSSPFRPRSGASTAAGPTPRAFRVPGSGSAASSTWT